MAKSDQEDVGLEFLMQVLTCIGDSAATLRAEAEAHQKENTVRRRLIKMLGDKR